ncbi:hypothetical protein D3C78_1009010 [compost metagenome]
MLRIRVEIALRQTRHGALPRLPRGAHRTQEQHSVVGGRVANEVTLVGELAGIAGWNDQVLAALAAIRADPAEVFDRPLPGIQQDAVLVAARNLHDQGAAVLQVEIAERVDDVVVTGLQRLVDLQTLVEDEQLVRLDAHPARAFGHRGEPDQWLTPDVGLHRPLVVELVVQALAGGCRGEVAGLEGEAGVGRRRRGFIGPQYGG